MIPRAAILLVPTLARLGALACLGLGAAACGHVNRLGEPGVRIARVGLEAGSVPRAALELDRRADRGEVAPQRGGVRTPHTYAQYHRAAEALAGPRLAEALVPAAAGALAKVLGWGPAGGEDDPRLALEVEDVAVLALDGSSSVEIRWRMRAELRDGQGGVLWRDRLERTRPAPGLSLERLGVADEAARAELLDGLAQEMAAVLADRLREDRERPGAKGR